MVKLWRKTKRQSQAQQAAQVAVERVTEALRDARDPEIVAQLTGQLTHLLGRLERAPRRTRATPTSLDPATLAEIARRTAEEPIVLSQDAISRPPAGDSSPSRRAPICRARGCGRLAEQDRLCPEHQPAPLPAIPEAPAGAYHLAHVGGGIVEGVTVVDGPRQIGEGELRAGTEADIVFGPQFGVGEGSFNWSPATGATPVDAQGNARDAESEQAREIQRVLDMRWQRR